MIAHRVHFGDQPPELSFGTGSTRESRLPLHGFQPQTNPKYHCSKRLYSYLALFETPNHALQLVENKLLA